MALAEQPAGGGEVADLERRHEPAHPLVLGEDVPQPARRDVVQSLERAWVEVSGAGTTGELQRMLELTSPLGVGGVLEASLERRSRRSGARRPEERGPAGARANRSRAGSRARPIRAGTPPGRGCRTGRRPPAARPAGRRGRARADRARSRRPRRARARPPPRAQRTTRAPLPAGRSDEIVPVRPTAGRPASPSSAATPCTYRAHPSAPRAVPVGGDGLRFAVALGHERDLALAREPLRAVIAVLDRDRAERARRCSRCAPRSG